MNRLMAVVMLLQVGSVQAELQFDLDARWQPELPEASAQAGGSFASEFRFQPSERRRGISRNLDLIAFGRYDADYQKHTHADLRELIYTYATRDYELRAGVGRNFWGVTEGAHLVDVINQEDWLEDVDGEDKLGQPLFSAAWTGDWGIWRAYALPVFREREYPDQALFPIPFPVSESEARFESSRGKQHADWALRWKHYFGGLDVAVSWFRGTNREPWLRPCAGKGTGRPGTEEQANCNLEEAFGQDQPSAAEEIVLDLGSSLGLTPSREELEDEAVQAALADVVLVPHYQQMQQWGLELQWVLGGWALKFEGRRRELSEGSQYAAASGFEYTQGAPWGWPADFGYVLEYLYDDREGEQGLSLLNNDVLIAWRGSFSDVAGTQILAGVIQDLDGQGRIYSIEASRRLGAGFSVNAELRVYESLPADDALEFLNQTDRLRFTLIYYL